MESTEGLKAAVNATLDEIEQLRSQLANAATLNNKMQADLMARDKQIKDLQAGLMTATGQYDIARSQLAEMNEKLLATQKVLEQAMATEGQLHSIINPNAPHPMSGNRL